MIPSLTNIAGIKTDNTTDTNYLAEQYLEQKILEENM